MIKKIKHKLETVIINNPTTVSIVLALAWIIWGVL